MQFWSTIRVYIEKVQFISTLFLIIVHYFTVPHGATVDFTDTEASEIVCPQSRRNYFKNEINATTGDVTIPTVYNLV